MTFHAQMRQRSTQTAAALAAKRKVYLDVRFWIVLRDVVRGKETGGDALALLDALRDGVARGAIVCPLSDSIFAELLKQEDESSRLATAVVIDELSRGATLRPIEARIFEEVFAALRLFMKSPDQRPAADFVWSCPAAMIGFDEIPPPEGYPIPIPVVIDKIHSLRLVDVLNKAGANLPAASPFTREFAAQMTLDSAHHADELRSFAQTDDAETRGAVEMALPFASAALDILARENGEALAAEPARDTTNGLLNMMHAILTKERFRHLMPTPRALASFHAAVRWDKKRQFHENDFYDFYHATAAFGYCDYLFVERSLASLAVTKHIKLPRRDEVTVAKDIGACVDIIRAVNRASAP